MIQKKVFLTYKRKRLSGSDLFLENGTHNTPSECRKSKDVAPLPKEEEKYDNPSFKDEKKDSEVRFLIYRTPFGLGNQTFYWRHDSSLGCSCNRSSCCCMRSFSEA